MAAALIELQAKPYSLWCAVGPSTASIATAARRRSRAREDQPATLEAAARHWIPLDLDSIPCPAGIDPLFEPDRVVEHVVELLPEEFHGAQCFWSFTAATASSRVSGIRLWFWADRPLADWELKLWLRDGPVDLSLYLADAADLHRRPRSSSACPTRCRSAAAPGAATATRSRRRSSRSRRHAQRCQGGTGGRQATAAATADHRDRIGDHDGGDGFFGPIKGAVGALFRENGAQADRYGCAPTLKTRSARHHAIRRSTTMATSSTASPISIR